MKEVERLNKGSNNHVALAMPIRTPNVMLRDYEIDRIGYLVEGGARPANGFESRLLAVLDGAAPADTAEYEYAEAWLRRLTEDAKLYADQLRNDRALLKSGDAATRLDARYLLEVEEADDKRYFTLQRWRRFVTAYSGNMLASYPYEAPPLRHELFYTEIQTEDDAGVPYDAVPYEQWDLINSIRQTEPLIPRRLSGSEPNASTGPK